MKDVIRRAIGGTRFLMLIAAIGAFLASLIALVYGLIIVVAVVKEVVRDHFFTMASVRVLASNLIEIIDLLLLGTVLYIVAIGLYKLFVDDEVKTPAWLTFKNLDDIKMKILGVVVVLIAVEFLAAVVEWTGKNILAFGAAIGIVLLALAAYMWVMFRHADSGKAEE